MPDQPGGRLGTESLANEQGSQRSSGRTAGIFNNAGSGTLMNPWKNNMLKYLAKRSPLGQKPQSVAPDKTSNTLMGAADPNVPGGPKEIQVMQQQMAQQGAAPPAPSQPIANPAGAPHNPPKEASMNKLDPHRIETARALLKFAACMKKSLMKGRRRARFGKKAGSDVPITSPGAPLGAAGIGAGLSLLGTAGARNPGLTRYPDFPGIEMLAKSDDKLRELLPSAFKRDEALTAMARKAPAWKAYGLPATLAAANFGAPVWMGARAAKNKGGAGRGAAAGTGVGAGTSVATTALLALLTRKNPEAAKAFLKAIPAAAAGGAAGGAVLGAIGGGIQKRRRTKAQAGGKKPEKAKKPEKSEKEARLRKRAALPWGKILGYGGAGLAGLGALAVGPPALRALSRGTERYFDPLMQQQYEYQKAMFSPQLAQLQMLRSLNPYGGMGMGGGMPPIMTPEDRDIIRYATYMRGLRSRAKALQEAFEA